MDFNYLVSWAMGKERTLINWMNDAAVQIPQSIINWVIEERALDGGKINVGMHRWTLWIFFRLLRDKLVIL